MKKLGLLVLVTLLAGCAELQQTGSHFVSSMVGLPRVITLYAADGKIIQQWDGNYNVEVSGNTARFMENNKAITISGTFTIIEK